MQKGKKCQNAESSMTSLKNRRFKTDFGARARSRRARARSGGSYSAFRGPGFGLRGARVGLIKALRWLLTSMIPIRSLKVFALPFPFKVFALPRLSNTRVLCSNLGQQRSLLRFLRYRSLLTFLRYRISSQPHSEPAALLKYIRRIW